MTIEKEQVKCIAKKWLEFSNQSNGISCFVSFYLYWIAFNTVYNLEEGRNDYAKINNFCNNNFEKLNQFNAFETNEINEIIGHGSIGADFPSGNQRHNDEAYKELISDNHERRMKGLFQTMRHIRNNLFHGHKNLETGEDEKLVHASSVLLKGYLEKYFE